MKNFKKIKEDNLKTRLQKIADTQRQESKFDGEITVKEEIQNPRIEASTNMNTTETHIIYDPSYAEQNPDKLSSIVKDVSLHEINHHGIKGIHKGYEFKGCPRNLELATRLIYENIFNILNAKGFSDEDIHYVENALEDTILHSDLSPVHTLNGIAHFFKEVGDYSKKFTPFYQAHVELNLSLFGTSRQKKTLKDYFTDDKEEKKKIKNVIDEFREKSGLNDLNASFKQVKNKKVLEEREIIRDFLNDERNWPEISKAYAEAFSKLMEPSYAMPLMNHSGAGTKGREKENSSGQGNPFQMQRKSKDYKIGRVQKAHKSGESAPEWIDSYEAMDLLYQGLAKKLAIEAKTFTESARFPLIWYGSRNFKSGRDNLENIAFGFDENARLQLKKKENSIDYQIPIKQSTAGFPKARFVLLDTSGSMAKDFNNGDNIGSAKIVPWGDRSKYHAALVEWYGFLEWLKENHLLERVGTDLVNFSSDTIYAKGLENAKKISLRPQFGSTKLNLNNIGEMFKGKGNLVLSISDGSIDNWDSISGSYLNGVKNHYGIHLQLGAETLTTKDLRQAGVHVENLYSPEELRGRVIILADKFYRK
ncbi:hypothetical protein J4404_02655 [Candidatus Woesearchaeota archaeon]|nr:hypothetical protein [Candidatus Woesearchaeota archaeon]